MNFRFQVVCSKYHKGRLKIVYDPCGNTTGTAEYNTAYTTIVDISDTTDFTIKVGWGQATTYRKSYKAGLNSSATFFDTIPLTYTVPGSTIGNGTIAVYVVNDLTVPKDAVPSPEINVFISMDDDFEVAVPYPRALNSLRITTDTVLNPPQSMEPQSDEAPPEEAQRMDSAPMSTPIENVMSSVTPIGDATNHIHFGERLKSFRQVLKRYQMHEAIGTGNPVGPIHDWLVTYRQALPFEPGFVTSSNISFPTTTPIGNYNYSFMTLMRYLTMGYGGWRGGIRWLMDASSVQADAGTLFINRGIQAQMSSGFVSVDSKLTSTIGFQSEFINNFDNHDGWNGIAMANKQVNPLASAEIPYYSIYRFAPGKARTEFVNFIPDYMPGLMFNYRGLVDQNDYVTTWVAAAEDFNLFFFLGAPIFYYEPTVPSA